jgi:hypothetical protein
MRENGQFLSLNEIREWRKQQMIAGQPNDLLDYYRVHDICMRCGGLGTVFTYLGGASKPSGTTICPSCQGTCHWTETK